MSYMISPYEKDTFPACGKASWAENEQNLLRDRRDGSSENELFFKKACLTFLSG